MDCTIKYVFVSKTALGGKKHRKQDKWWNMTIKSRMKLLFFNGKTIENNDKEGK